MLAPDRQPIYTIGTVERLTGLSARRIRYYEQLGLLKPARSPARQRLFSRADVALLKRVKELLDQGYRLDGVRALLRRLT